MLKISSLLFVFLTFGVASSVTNYVLAPYTMSLTDKSNGALTASQIQSTVNLFFQVYPGLAAGYSNAPKTVAVTLDPSVAQGSLGVSSSGISMSVANIQSNPNDSSYMSFGLNYMLSNFYTAGTAGPTTKAATTQKPTTAASGSGSPQMTAALRTMVLNAHNNYRSQLAKGQVQSATGTFPAGTNINQLVYDMNLETLAANWGAQCVVGHTPGSNSYGQNFWAISSTSSDVTATIVLQNATASWWSERTLYQGTGTTLTTDMTYFEKIGHFTQMAWCDTKSVGCSVNFCPGVGTIVFCDYDHGNVPGYPIYTAGTTCSQCSAGCSSSGNGLCNPPA